MMTNDFQTPRTGAAKPCGFEGPWLKTVQHRPRYRMHDKRLPENKKRVDSPKAIDPLGTNGIAYATLSYIVNSGRYTDSSSTNTMTAKITMMIGSSTDSARAEAVSTSLS